VLGQKRLACSSPCLKVRANIAKKAIAEPNDGKSVEAPNEYLFDFLHFSLGLAPLPYGMPFLVISRRPDPSKVGNPARRQLRQLHLRLDVSVAQLSD
jgi:hypothetical protein